MWCQLVVLLFLLGELHAADSRQKESIATSTEGSSPAPSTGNLTWVITIGGLTVVGLLLFIIAWRLFISRREKSSEMVERQAEMEEINKKEKPSRSPTYQEMLDATPPSELSPPTQWIE